MMDQARRQREAKAEHRSTGGKLKDKLLGSTKQERAAKRTEKAAMRAKQEEEERVSYGSRSSTPRLLSEINFNRLHVSLSGVCRRPVRSTWKDVKLSYVNKLSAEAMVSLAKRSRHPLL
jgi:hypothetical protein